MHVRCVDRSARRDAEARDKKIRRLSAHYRTDQIVGQVERRMSVRRSINHVDLPPRRSARPRASCARRTLTADFRR